MNNFLNEILNKLSFYFKLLILSPGVIVHELAHVLFCIISNVKIRKIKLFQFSEIAGYVEHDKPANLFSAFFISFGPLFLNTVVSYFLFKEFNMNFDESKNLLFLYLGISISFSSIPSDIDGNAFGFYIKDKVKRNLLFFPIIIFLPLV